MLDLIVNIIIIIIIIIPLLCQNESTVIHIKCIQKYINTIMKYEINQ